MVISASDSLDLIEKDWKALPFSHLGSSENFVLGTIKLDAKILLVAEAPGREEDEQGEPLIGDAGKRLNEALKSAGIDRSQCSITNVYPRRPKNNKKPPKKDILAQGPFLDRLVSLHKNLKAVCLLGGTALQWKTGREKIEDHRGDEFQRDGVWWLPTLHPSATLYRRSKFKWLQQDIGWLKALASGEVFDTSSLAFPYIDDEALVSFFPDIQASPISYVDIETAAEEPASALWYWDPRTRLVLLSFGWLSDNKPKAIVVEYNSVTAPIIRDLLASNPRHWTGSNALYYDFPFLRRIGLPPLCQRTPLDSYPIAKMVDENRGVGAKDLSKEHFKTVNYAPYWGEAEEREWQRKWIEWPSMTEAERQERIAYAGKDAWLGIQTLQIEVERLRKKPHLVKAYMGLVIPQAQALEEMNLEGLPVNLERAKEKVSELEAKIEEISARLLSIVPAEYLPDAKPSKRKVQSNDLFCSTEIPESTEKTDINFQSSQQVSALLERVGFPRLKITDSGDRASADRFVLLRLLDFEADSRWPSWAFDVIDGTLDIRDAVKDAGFLKSIVKFAEMSYDGRVHATFRIGPVTWRITSEEPNAQQWASRIKEVIEAPEGWVFGKLDFGALELCGMADSAPEPVLIRRFKNGEDLHWRHACGFMGLGYDDTFAHRKEGKNKKVRDAFKTLIYGGGYGAGPGTLADQLRDDFRKIGIGPDTVREILATRNLEGGEDIFYTLAKEWLNWLKDEYPNIKRDFYRTADRARRDGFVRSKFGFERHPQDLHSEDKRARGDAERQAYNTPIQMLSLLTFLAYRRLKQIRTDMGLEQEVRLIVQEHDSLLFLIRDGYEGIWMPTAAEAMTTPDWNEWGASFLVPLTADWEVSKKWG